jgi:hypothetical protein
MFPIVVFAPRFYRAKRFTPFLRKQHAKIYSLPQTAYTTKDKGI